MVLVNQAALRQGFSPIKKEGLEYRQLPAADKTIVDQCVSDSR